MTLSDWAALIRVAATAATKAAADFKANKARPAAVSMTAEQAIAVLEEVETAIPVLSTYLAAHPGALTALDDLEPVLASEGIPWASAAQGGVDGAPSALAKAAEVFALLDGLMKGAAPVPTWQPGPEPYHGR